MVSVTVIFGLVIAFCFGSSDFLSKGLTGQVGAYRTTIYTLTTSGIFVIVPSLLFGLPKALSFTDVAVLALVAFSTFAAFLFMYKGYQRGNLSVVSPTVNSFPIFSVVFAVIVLKVTVSDQVLLALAGVIVGIILVSTNISGVGAMRGRSITPGVPEAILAAFFFAMGFTLLGYADETIGYLLPVVSARLGAASVGFLAGISLKQNLSPFGGRPLLRVIAMGALEAGGLLSFSLALFYSSTIGALPIITTLSGSERRGSPLPHGLREK
ncbi:MAG: DMT family transporter [Thaumarchaeota archaeon]|nr:DMT family transporter [Nitrososphaerota archaeon]